MRADIAIAVSRGSLAHDENLARDALDLDGEAASLAILDFVQTAENRHVRFRAPAEALHGAERRR